MSTAVRAASLAVLLLAAGAVLADERRPASLEDCDARVRAAPRELASYRCYWFVARNTAAWDGATRRLDDVLRRSPSNLHARLILGAIAPTAATRGPGRCSARPPTATPGRGRSKRRSTRGSRSASSSGVTDDRTPRPSRQKNEFQVMKKSAMLSVVNLSKAYPVFSKSEISKIRGLLVEGKVDNLFMNADGTNKEDAAELVAYAMYGKKMLESVRKVAKRQGESEANQKILDSSPKQLRKLKSSGGNAGLNKEAVGDLSGVFRPDPYA